MFPDGLVGAEEQFARRQREIHMKVWGESVTPQTVYTGLNGNWEAFSCAFPHQAFLIRRLMGIYENLAVVLRILREKLREDARVHRRNENFPPPPSIYELREFGSGCFDPLLYFQDDEIDFAYRKVFLELFVCLETEKKGTKQWAMWREIGRMILENSCDAERASLVEELTSAASAEAFSAVTGPSTHSTGRSKNSTWSSTHSTEPSTNSALIWWVPHRIDMKETAMKKALARLRELLEDDKKKMTLRCSDDVLSARSAGDAIHIDFDEKVIPIREKRRYRSPVQSDDESVEIIDEDE